MRKYSSNLAFVDLLFNLLVGFTSLFIIAFLMINPIAKQGTVEPPVMMLVEVQWDDDSRNDVDLWIKGPSDLLVGYTRKDGGYANLERDDLGIASDSYTVNGEKILIRRNYEVVSFTALPDGEYIINVQMFTGLITTDEPVRIRVTIISPFNVVYEGEVILKKGKQEITAVSFIVEDGKVVDSNTKIQKPVKTAPVGEHG